MSVRFVIRKFDNGFHRWSLRDALCVNSEHHDFLDFDWVRDCSGACDTFRYFASAITTADENK